MGMARSLTLLAAFAAIGIAFYLLFKIWADGKLGYFIFVGDTQSAAIVLAVILFFGWLVKKLWKTEVHMLFGQKRGK
ncbi:MAG: hypothetical protein HY544_04870 [Candidatus Diapherotrites archaeon]|uniref:Uncharacterized protein n=1 Tax=Candidatus Iainarchaeum sp. TaxID=3101447 RepID=A0A8T3YPY8_9ARCH|nr:hypothetical protein [Candidatus Diapherotrites archaeon]